MKREIIEAVQEYYDVSHCDAIKIINLRVACGEFDELLRDLREENFYIGSDVNV